MSNQYVCGFAFDLLGRLVLIRKKRPEWQAGRLNGVGGHQEPGETPEVAMAREFYEETGVGCRAENWRLFFELTIEDTGDVCRFFVLNEGDVPEMDLRAA